MLENHDCLIKPGMGAERAESVAAVSRTTEDDLSRSVDAETDFREESRDGDALYAV